MSEPEASRDPWEHLQFDLADRLRRSLRISKVSVQAMADELGVVRDTVGNYINGHTHPGKATLVVWSMKTGFPLEWLETGQMPVEAITGRYFSGLSPLTTPPLQHAAPVRADTARSATATSCAVVDLATFRAQRAAVGRRPTAGRTA